MKYSLGISNFLEEISSLSHSVVFLYFFALITEDGLLISPCFSWELCIQMDLSFSTLLFTSLLFTAICKASSDSHFAFCISFPWRWSFFFFFFSNFHISFIPNGPKLGTIKWPSTTGEWKQKWHINMTGYFSRRKGNEILRHATTWLKFKTLCKVKKIQT